MSECEFSGTYVNVRGFSAFTYSRGQKYCPFSLDQIVLGPYMGKFCMELGNAYN